MTEPVAQLWSALDGLGLRPHVESKGWNRAACPVCDKGNGDRSFFFRQGDKHPIRCGCHRAGRDGHTIKEIADATGLPAKSFFFDSTNGTPRLRTAPQDGTKATKPVANDSPTYEPPTDEQIQGWNAALESESERLAYLQEQRGLSLATIATQRIGWNGQRYTLPVCNPDGTVGHVLGYLPGGKPKMKAPPGCKRIPFGLEHLAHLEDGTLLLVVEGEPDALACMSAGYRAIGVPGAKGWRSEWAERYNLARFDCVAIGDADKAGGSMAAEVAASIPGCRVPTWPENSPAGHDCTDQLLADPEAFRKLAEDAQALPEEPSNFEVADSDIPALTDTQEWATYPEIPAACYRGAVKTYIDAMASRTETGAGFHYFVFQTLMGLRIGRRARLEGIYPNLFTVLVGLTGKYRKSSCANEGKDRLLVGCEYVEVEGATYEGILQQLAETNKPILFTPPEYRMVADRIKTMHGASLAGGLINLYDNRNLASKATVTDGLVRAEMPTFVALTTTTGEWLTKAIAKGDFASGVTNRWTFAIAHPSRPMPRRQQEPDADGMNEVRQAIEQMEMRLSRYTPFSPLSLEWGEGAGEIFDAFYIELYEKQWANSNLESMAQRLQDLVFKVATIDALMGGETTVSVPHIKSAILLARYQMALHERLFIGFGDSPIDKCEKRIRELVAALIAKDGEARKATVQQRLCGTGGFKTWEFNDALSRLERADILHTHSDVHTRRKTLRFVPGFDK